MSRRVGEAKQYVLGEGKGFCRVFKGGKVGGFISSVRGDDGMVIGELSQWWAEVCSEGA